MEQEKMIILNREGYVDKINFTKDTLIAFEDFALLSLSWYEMFFPNSNMNYASMLSYCYNTLVFKINNIIDDNGSLDYFTEKDLYNIIVKKKNLYTELFSIKILNIRSEML